MVGYDVWLDGRDEIAHILMGIDNTISAEEATSRATRVMPPAPAIDGKEIVTESLIESLKSPSGGYTAKALASIGISWPPASGWQQSVLGKPRVSIPLKGRIAWRDRRDAIRKRILRENPKMKHQKALNLADEEMQRTADNL